MESHPAQIFCSVCSKELADHSESEWIVCLELKTNG